MIVELHKHSGANIKRYLGLSSDVKPIENVADGSEFMEIDTSDEYIFANRGWIQVDRHRSHWDIKIAKQQVWLETVTYGIEDEEDYIGTVLTPINHVHSLVTLNGGNTAFFSNTPVFAGNTSAMYQIEAVSVQIPYEPPEPDPGFQTVFRYKKTSYYLNTWSAPADVIVINNSCAIDGVALSFTDVAVGDKYRFIAGGSWHTAEIGMRSYLGELYICASEGVKVDYAPLRVNVYANDAFVWGTDANQIVDKFWQLPFYAREDGINKTFEVRLAEFETGKVERITLIMKGWDE